MASILILSFSDLGRDPRVNRQIQFLSGQHKVIAAGLSDPCVHGVEFVALRSLRKPALGRATSLLRLLLRKHKLYHADLPAVIDAKRELKGRHFDLIIANDSNTWPLALAIKGRAKVIMDAHEFYPREREDSTAWRILYRSYQDHLCRTCLPRADGVLTVCEGIADEYQRVYGVRPRVVMNVAQQHHMPPIPPAADAVRMIHHGVATPSRQIEKMILTMDHLDARFSLDLMLLPQSETYMRKLLRLAASRPRVRIIPPVEMPRIPATINTYDIGFYLLQPNNFNNLHSLPNKFFEFIQARLAVVTGPSPEMSRLINQHGLGVVAESFQPMAIAATLRPMTQELLTKFKENANTAATLLCWDHESKVLQAECDRLLAQRP